MRSNDDIIYSISVEGVQNVALENLGRPLTDGEIELIDNKLGDHLDWYGAIALAIEEVVDKE